jgi:hypothetical protein
VIVLTHLRTAVVAALKTANLDGIGDRVFPSRSRKTWPDGDCILVYTQTVEADDQDTAPVNYNLVGTVEVQIRAQESEEDDATGEEEEELETRLDAYAEAVLVALHPIEPSAAGPFGGLVDWFKFTGTRPHLSAAGEVLKGSRIVSFSAIWNQFLPSQDAPDALRRFGTTLGGPTEAQAGNLDAQFSTEVEP